MTDSLSIAVRAFASRYIYIYTHTYTHTHMKWYAVFPSSGRVDAAVWMHYIDAKKKYREKAASNIEQVLEAAVFHLSMFD